MNMEVTKTFDVDGYKVLVTAKVYDTTAKIEIPELNIVQTDTVSQPQHIIWWYYHAKKIIMNAKKTT